MDGPHETGPDLPSLRGMTYAPPPPFSTTASAEGHDAPLPGATFGQAVARFYGRYATFSGRASRSEYWWVALFMALVFIAFAIVTGVAGAATADSSGRASEPSPAAIVVALLFVVFHFGSFVPSIALNARRLHDANFSGWVQLVSLVPSIGGIIMMVFAALPSSPAGARFDAAARFDAGARFDGDAQAPGY